MFLHGLEIKFKTIVILLFNMIIYLIVLLYIVLNLVLFLLTDWVLFPDYFYSWILTVWVFDYENTLLLLKLSVFYIMPYYSFVFWF